MSTFLQGWLKNKLHKDYSRTAMFHNTGYSSVLNTGYFLINVIGRMTKNTTYVYTRYHSRILRDLLSALPNTLQNNRTTKNT